MKLDPKGMRYLTPEDWRVLTAVETGTRTHELVPTTLIGTLSGLRSSVHKSISALAKLNLIAKLKNAKYDGYRLAYGGLDYLALHAHQRSKLIYSVGNQIGTGKESDILVVASPSGKQLVLKIHRLGRISFRTVKNNRDYLKRRHGDGSGANWMQMSALAARKEYMFMRALWEGGFPVPEPMGWNRHTVVMELVDAFPLRQIKSVPDPAGLYGELVGLVMQFAGVGLIHGDFNEFNVLIKEVEVEEEMEKKSGGDPETPLPDESRRSTTAQGPEDSRTTDLDPKTCTKTTRIKLIPIVIDFPQTLSIDHPNAPYYFSRDINCIKTFFKRRFHFTSNDPGPFYDDAIKALKTEVGKGVEKGGADEETRKDSGASRGRRLDVGVEASGFSRKMARELETYMKDVGVDGDGGGGIADEGDDDGESNEDEDEEEEERDADEEVTREGNGQVDSLGNEIPETAPADGMNKLRLGSEAAAVDGDS